MDENNLNDINNTPVEEEQVCKEQQETVTAEEVCNNTEPQYQEQEPYRQQAYQRQAPTGGRFVYFADGTRRFIPNGAYYQQPIQPPKKKSKAGIIVGAVLVSLAFVVMLTTIAAFMLGTPLLLLIDRQLAQNDASYQPPVDESYIVDNSSQTPIIPDDASVPDIVDVAPVPDESFDSLVALYNESVKSCVTILCDVQIDNGFFTQEGQSLGSGFVIEGTKDGKSGLYIVTNQHVIEGAKKIRVKYHDGEIYDATLLGADELTDIAVLKTERADIEPIELGDSNMLSVGQWVVAIGTPSAEELQNTMSYGIISGLNRKIPVSSTTTGVKTMTVIQTTATLNPGNSGGPLINMAGQVVGINAMKLMEDYEGIGFALPSTEASKIINSLIEYGVVIDGGGSFVSGTAQLGITGATVTDEVRVDYSLGSDCPDGVLVINVSRGTAVYEAGLSISDVITEFNGVKVDTIEKLKEEISNCNAGEKVTLKYYRAARDGQAGGYYTISFRLDTAK